jgi:thiamine transport system permease protein
MQARRVPGTLLTLPVLFLAIFFLYPLAAIFGVAFAPGGRFSLQPLVELLQEPFVGRVLWFTTWQALLSTLLTLLIGIPAAYLFARFRFPGRSVLKALTSIPFVMPTTVVAAAFLALLGPRGWLNEALMRLFGLETGPIRLQQSIWLILLAHAFYNVTIVVRMVSGFWERLDPRLGQAAATLGARPLRVLREVTLPLLLPSVLSAGLLVFLFCFSSFGVILLLGGVRFATIEVEVYRQAVALYQIPIAAALTLLQMLVTLALMVFHSRQQRRLSVSLSMPVQTEAAQRPRGRQWLLVGLVGGGLLLYVTAPLAALALRSLAAGDPLRYYRELFVNRTSSIFYVAPAAAIRNSLWFAGQAMVSSVFLGGLAAYATVRERHWFARGLEPLILLPLGTSAVTLGFGYVLTMGRPPLALSASPWLIPIAHTLVAFPFVVRTILPSLRSLDPHWREAAQLLGADNWAVWRHVELPLVWRSFVVAAGFAFTISLGEFGATLLIARPEYPTMPIAIYRFLGQPGALNYGQGLAMSCLLMLVCGLSLLLIDRFRLTRGVEF